MYECVDMWMCGFMDVWIYECVDMWKDYKLSGYMNMMCGCVNVWICGYLDIWICGYLDKRM